MKALKKVQLSCTKSLILSCAVLVAMALTACNKKQVEGGTTASGNRESRNVPDYTGLQLAMPNSLSHFKTNDGWGYNNSLNVPSQLENNNFAIWFNHPEVLNAKLKNHPYAWSSPRVSKLKNGNNYQINTLFSMVDPDGVLLKKGGVGPFGTACITITTKKSKILGFIDANIPGQLTNAGIFADQNYEWNGFVATDPASTWPTATPFFGRPDAMEVIFKARPKGSDRATFEVMLHQNKGSFNPAALDTRLPAKYPSNANGMANYIQVDSNVVGYSVAKVTTMANDQYYKATVPIYYKDDHTKPDYLIVNLTSSDGYQIIDGSELEVCKVNFVYK